MRRAVIDDIPALVKLAETMHAEGSYKDIPFDADFYGDVLNICLLSDTEIIFVFIKDGVLAGAIHGSIEPFMFNAKYTQAVDRGFFVRPEYRGSSIAVKLERAYRKWAADKERSGCVSNTVTGMKRQANFL